MGNPVWGNGYHAGLEEGIKAGLKSGRLQGRLLVLPVAAVSLVIGGLIKTHYDRYTAKKETNMKHDLLLKSEEKEKEYQDGFPAKCR